MTRYLVLGIVGAVFLGVVLVVADLRTRADVRYGLRGFQPVSPRTVAITFDVQKAPLAKAVCAVRALGQDRRELGRADVTVPQRGDGRRLTTVDYQLATTARAVSAEVVGCQITRDH